MTRANVYAVRCQLDGEWAEVNVWAMTKQDAALALLHRFNGDGTTVAIDTMRRISTDGLHTLGTVLVIR